MHVIEFLNSAENRDDPVNSDVRQVEYRLLCSGTLFPSNFLGDWLKSDVARILLQCPFELLVASDPYDDYPQELVLRFEVSSVTEKVRIVTMMFHPDEEIASDISALMTLMFRRLVTVSGKVRERCQHMSCPDVMRDYPIPFATTMRSAWWTPRPIQCVVRRQGTEILSSHPRDKAFCRADVSQILLALPKLKAAPAIVRASRQYALAMKLIDAQPDLCYQLLVTATETMANAAYGNWEPEEREKIASKREFLNYATTELKLDSDVAEKLALESCRGNPWSKRKFKKFLLENYSPKDLEHEDDLFCVPPSFCPPVDDYERAIDRIYASRSGATHGGVSFPASATIGPSGRVPIRAMAYHESPFPPIGWFERIVNSSIFGFWRTQTTLHTTQADEA